MNLISLSLSLSTPMGARLRLPILSSLFASSSTTSPSLFRLQHRFLLRQKPLSAANFSVQRTTAEKENEVSPVVEDRDDANQKSRGQDRAITPLSQDFIAWYLDVIANAELADCGPVRGTMVIRPYGYVIWEAIQFTDENGHRQHVWQTSWAISTRFVGGIIMTHGDDAGLMLPPKLAPVQVVIVPIWKKADDKTGVLNAALSVKDVLKIAGVKVNIDDSDQRTPGWKFNFWEMEGVPLRIEIGPRDVSSGSVTISRRDIPGKQGKVFRNLWNLQFWWTTSKISWMRFSHHFWKGQHHFEIVISWM